MYFAVQIYDVGIKTQLLVCVHRDFRVYIYIYSEMRLEFYVDRTSSRITTSSNPRNIYNLAAVASRRHRPIFKIQRIQRIICRTYMRRQLLDAHTHVIHILGGERAKQIRLCFA